MVNLFDVNDGVISKPDLRRARFSFNKSGGGALCVREYSESDVLTTLGRKINFRFRYKIAFGLVRPGHVSIVGKTLEHGDMWVVREFYIGPKERDAVGTLTEIVEAFYSWIKTHPERHPNCAQWALVPNECWLQDTKIRSPRDGCPVVAHKGHHVRYELSHGTFLWSSVNSLLREKMTRPKTPLSESFVLCEQHHYWCPAVENLFLEYGGQFPPELILLPIERHTLMGPGDKAFFADIPWTPLPPSSENSEVEIETVDDDGMNWMALPPSSRNYEDDLEMVDEDDVRCTTPLPPLSGNYEAQPEEVDDNERKWSLLPPSSGDFKVELEMVDDDDMNGEADELVLQILSVENGIFYGSVLPDEDSFVLHGYTNKTRKADDGNGGEGDNYDKGDNHDQGGTAGEGSNSGEGGYNSDDGNGSDSGSSGEMTETNGRKKKLTAIMVPGYLIVEPMDVQEAPELPMLPEEPPLSMDIMASPTDAVPDLTSGSGLEALPEIGLYGLPAANIMNWMVEDVAEWLRAIGCGEYAKDFSEQEIDGAALMLLKAEHLMQFMDVERGPALEVCKKIEELRASCNVSVSPAPESGPASE